MRTGGWGGRPGDAKVATGRRIAGTAVLQFVLRAFNIALGAVVVVVIARSLGPDGFGVWSTALAFVGIFGILADFGLRQVATQRMAAEPERESEWLGALFGSVAVASVFSFGLIVAAIPLLSDEGDVHLVTFVLAFGVLAVALGVVPAVFDSRVRTELRMGVLTLNSLAWLAIVVVLDAREASIVAFAVAFVVLSAITGVAEFLVTRRFARIAVRRGRALWRPLWRVAFPVGVGSALIMVYYRIDSVLIFSISGPEEAGVYGAAYRFLDPLGFIPASVLTAIFPVVAALHGRDPNRVRRLAQQAGEYLVVIALGVLGVAIALSGPLIEFLLGTEFDRTAGLLPILMLAFVFVALGSLAGYLVPVVGLQWRFVAFAAIGVVMNIALNLILIPPYGAFGAAWATVATELAVNGLTLAAVFRALEFRPSVGRILRAAVAAAVMTGVVALAARLGLAVGVMVAPPTYAATLIVLRVIAPAEVRDVFKARNPPDGLEIDAPA